MNLRVLLLLLSLVSGKSWAVKLSDYSPYSFEVLFTNPVCQTYKYESPVYSESGVLLNSKPDDVYCKTSDENTSVYRKNAPQLRLIEWITAKETKEIYVAFLSFSNTNVVKAMCSALKKGVKI